MKAIIITILTIAMATGAIYLLNYTIDQKEEVKYDLNFDYCDRYADYDDGSMTDCVIDHIWRAYNQ